MSSKIRKNASLAAVAAAARTRANNAKAVWLKYEGMAKEMGHLQMARQWQAALAWDRYSDLDEIAGHLERLSSS